MKKITIESKVTVLFATPGTDNATDQLCSWGKAGQFNSNTIRPHSKDILQHQTPWDNIYKKFSNLSNQMYNYHLTIQPDPKMVKLDVYDDSIMLKHFKKFINQNHSLLFSLAGTMEMGKNLKPHLHIIFSANNKNARQFQTNAKKLYTFTTKNNVAAVLRPINDRPGQQPCHITWCGERSDEGNLPNHKKYKYGYCYLRKEKQNRKKLLFFKEYNKPTKTVVRLTKEEKEIRHKLLYKEYPID